ncbi:MAG: acyl-CoA dehydratase activase, partial [Spirochaetota bacterium]
MLIGIDAGSKFLKISNSQTGENIAVDHAGSPEDALGRLEKDVIPAGAAKIFTGHYGEYLAAKYFSVCCDEVSAAVASAGTMPQDIRFIVNVGSGSVRCIELDGAKKFLSYRENTLCAAGTGSFLDEQMRRMGFTYDALSDIPFTETPPDIATRCAVFAKSDLIHRQQEGFSREQMWNGLCRGVVMTMLGSAFKGELPSAPVLFCGGLFENKIVREWVSRAVSHALFDAQGQFIASKGAALWGSAHKNETKRSKADIRQEKIHERFVLDLKKSTPWKDCSAESRIEDGNEIRIQREISAGEPFALGIDIGSTSTKLALLDCSGEVVLDIYRKTGGDPVAAAAKLFASLSSIVKGKNIEICAAAATGSGRKLIGRIIGADLIVNEITAHFAGARASDPGIETIFEIGGQDSKYIRGSHGNVADCNMNFVCAAGTGSFIEEQASRLGFDVRDIGGIITGLSTPHTSDRCTVFMEQDINKLLREGYSREEALAGVIYSIAKNYMARVVGARPVTGDKIFFQGATARNKGLVAAFELLTGKEVIVSPNCHVMGSFGAALLAQKAVSGKSRFRGLDVFTAGFDISYETCTQCLNKCTISVVVSPDGAKDSWGYKCGREEGGARPEKADDHFRSVLSMMDRKASSKERGTRGLIGIPRALSHYSYLPLWRTFFEELGYEVKVTGVSTRKEKEKGVRIAKADFCFPVKVALAHTQELSQLEIVD